MTLLVTGAAGFIGSCFVRQHFEHSTETVISLDALTYAGHLSTLAMVMHKPQHIFVHASIGDGDAVSAILAQHRPRAIVNFAAETHVDRSISQPEIFIQTNVVGTACLLNCALDYWRDLDATEKEVFRFLHVSTDEVYGSLLPHESAFAENSPYQPNSPYSASKAASDHLVRAWHQTHGLPVLTTHCSNNYGPYHFPEKLIPLVISNALLEMPLPIYGDGLQIRDWLFVEDHTRGIRNVLEKGIKGETYNIGTGTEKTNLALVKSICGLLDELKPRPGGGRYSEQIVFVADRPGHDRRYAMNADKIRTQLGWEPQETFETGIRKTVQWYLCNPTWISQVTANRQIEI